MTAQALARAGADVVVGSHAHVLQGAGWLGRTLVSYGLGNFVWYHDNEPQTGVLRVEIRNGRVAGPELVPARIGQWGRPWPVSGAAAAQAAQRWSALRGCAGLEAWPG